jgi:CheY-like chemotaxis protein
MSSLLGSEASYDLGPYRLLGIIRRDVQVALCAAIHRDRGEHRVLTLVLPGRIPGLVARRFLRQARALASIEHIGLPATYESGRLPAGGAWAAVPAAEGESLHQWLNRTGSLKGRPALAAAIVAAVADACSCLARAGLVHGDLRPINVRLVPEGGSEGRFRVRLMGSDKAALRSWRVARSEGAETSPAALYRAPELWASGARPDVRSDIRALGCLFFELLTGTIPFPDIDRREGPPPDLPTLVPGIAPEMGRSIERMLARAPSRRYQTMDEVVTAIELMLGRHRSRFAELLTSQIPLLPPEPEVMSSDLTPLAPAFAGDATDDWISGTLDTIRDVSAAAREAVGRRLAALRRQEVAGCEGKPTVLVAEDDDDTRQSIMELLEDNGYRVVAARHGREAQELLQNGMRAQCMLMDLWMPEIDGWTLAAQMQEGRLPSIPTIVMTAAEPHWGYPCPIVVRKPFDTHRLLDLVKTVAGSPIAADRANGDHRARST